MRGQGSRRGHAFRAWQPPRRSSPGPFAYLSVSVAAASGCNCLPLTNNGSEIKCGVAAVLPSKRVSALSSFRSCFFHREPVDKVSLLHSLPKIGCHMPQ